MVSLISTGMTVAETISIKYMHAGVDGKLDIYRDEKWLKL